MQLHQNILAVDAGFRNLGYAVWQRSSRSFTATGCIRTQKDDSLVRVNNVLSTHTSAKGLLAVCRQHSIRRVVAELPTGTGKSAKAVAAMCMALAVVVTVCAAVNAELVVVWPEEIKRLVSKRLRKVSKQETIALAEKLYGTAMLPKGPTREHVADAMLAFRVYQLRSK